MSLFLALALLAGPAEDVQVAVLGHAVSKGDRLEAGDFTMEGRTVAAARGALGIEDAAGMEATRNLAPGTIVRRTDVMTPQLVRRGEPVTIKLASGTLLITASGRALTGGGKGDMVRVVTNSTSRTLDGMVDGSGVVRVSAP
ncbi:flagellar basal body P-ring formation chaperone FlgA [Sphingomonas xinjiangensis]|uniref:Flagella basal body P-ring formation protein FlgA n=1 Tax=Sphingomonas xinjiangensis TaxID=643568 RepID=A0A840YQ40_9SPHN|nr:flagellar basal body P-ring formation chaperone FlgA [Sphingomonas xinjiangensis]MBB5710771.1 flagella basal body P-ring formation protein FlgA [Sphingomonas xinjiangensis]